MADRGRGRGWYYKAKYGRGRRRSADFDAVEPGAQAEAAQDASENDEDMSGAVIEGTLRGSAEDLERKLIYLQKKSYSAYRDILGIWAIQTDTIKLYIDYVQKDPYAAPSRFRVKVANAAAGFPLKLRETRTSQIALCDYLTRSFAAALKRAGADTRMIGRSWASAKGGEMTIDCGKQHVLERTSVLINNLGDIEARFTVALPGKGRQILGTHAAESLCKGLPSYIKQGLLYHTQDLEALARHVQCVEDTEALRAALPSHGLVAFIANGSILPRLSGACEEPLPAASSVPFISPPSLEVAIELPRGVVVKGMGIRKGVTLICGGGFHGKTTMLKALEAGYTNKIPGDGREMVVTLPDACKIRAEDGRRVEGVNISPFISNLPMGKDTDCFCTDDASGSTSQAANIMEALEVGTRLLLIDEDTTATNFMIRDARMQELVAPDKEPIKPLVSKIRGLVSLGVSFVLVIGGSGSYFEVADTVIAMDNFRARDVTQQAHQIARRASQHEELISQHSFGAFNPRIPTFIAPEEAGRRFKVRADLHSIKFGLQHLDLNCVEQLLDPSQTRAIASILRLFMRLIKQPGREGRTLAELLEGLQSQIDAQGLDAVALGSCFGDWARPRSLEIAAAFNRLRSIKVRQEAMQDLSARS